MSIPVHVRRLEILLLVLASAAIVVAADTVAGKWESQPPGDKATFEFKVDGSRLLGQVTVGGTAFPLESGKVVDAKTISFSWTTSFPPEGNPVRRSATGKVDGDQITLTIDGLIESTQQK